MAKPTYKRVKFSPAEMAEDAPTNTDFSKVTLIGRGPKAVEAMMQGRTIPLVKHKPARASNPPRTKRYGARIFPLQHGKALIKQTVKKGAAQSNDYVIDQHRERHVDLSKDSEVAQAVRDALSGQLPP